MPFMPGLNTLSTKLAQKVTGGGSSNKKQKKEDYPRSKQALEKKRKEKLREGLEASKQPPSQGGYSRDPSKLKQMRQSKLPEKYRGPKQATKGVGTKPSPGQQSDKGGARPQQRKGQQSRGKTFTDIDKFFDWADKQGIKPGVGEQQGQGQKNQRSHGLEVLNNIIGPTAALNMRASTGGGGSQPVKEGRQQAADTLSKIRKKARGRYEEAQENLQSLGEDASNQELFQAHSRVSSARDEYLTATDQRGQLAREFLRQKAGMGRTHAQGQYGMGRAAVGGQYNLGTAGVRGAFGLDEQEMRGRQEAELQHERLQEEELQNQRDRFTKIQAALIGNKQGESLTQENLNSIISEEMKRISEKNIVDGLSDKDLNRLLSQRVGQRLSILERLTGEDYGANRLLDPAGIGKD